MKIKQLIKNVCTVFVALMFSYSPIIHAMDDHDTEIEMFDIDNSISDESSLFLLDQLDIPLETPPHTSKAVLTGMHLASLGGLLKGLGINEPLWITTRPEKGRDILYLMPSKIAAIEYGGVSCNIFFNMTSQMHLTGGNLLNIDQISDPSFLEHLISGAPAGIKEIFKDSSHIGSLLPFFKKITIQERKLGPYFQTGFVRGAFTAQLHTSVQLGERNFYLSDKDLDELTALNKLIFNDTQSFDRNDLYRIRIGLGDTRIKLGLNSLSSKIVQTDVGVECIVPTSRTSRKPLTDIETSDADLNDDGRLARLGFDSLFKIRDHLLTPEIGNGGHLGVGFYLDTKINLFGGLADLRTHISFDKFFEADEQRLMLYKKDLTVQNLIDSGGASDKEAAQKAVAFAKQYLLPLPYKVAIEPGGIFNAVVILNIPYKKWNFRYGYDFYYEQPERFKQIYTSSAIVPLLDQEIARMNTRTQHKISSETTYRIKNFNNVNLDIGFGGDTTIAAHGIGKDFTMYLKLASEF